MVVRAWGASVATAIGIAAGAGAAQLGIGYGLGIIAWPTETTGEGEPAWVASLAWATWIAMTSVAAGAIAAGRVESAARSAPDTPADRERFAARARLATSLSRVVLAVAASLGALVTVALVAVPARAVEHAGSSAPQTIAGGYAVTGVVVGLAVALGALAARAVAANIIASVTWLWALAVIGVADGVIDGRGLDPAQLAAWQFTSSGPRVLNIEVWQAALTLGSALVIGVLAALPAARRGDGAIGVAISGAVGPLLVAAAYLLAAPALTETTPQELSAYLLAPYAVITGLAGSVAVAALASRSHRSEPVAVADAPTVPQPRPAEATAGAAKS